jgi:hypothetical protein
MDRIFGNVGAEHAEGADEWTFRAFGNLFSGVISMHCDHDVFVQGMEQKRRLKLTFYEGINLQHIVRECAPLHYSKGQVEGDDLDSYYIWDFENTKDNHFLALPPSQIITMELAEETFNIEDFSSHRTKQQSQQKIQTLRPKP